MFYRKYRGLSLPVWSTFKLDGTIKALESLFEEGRHLLDVVASLRHPRFYDVIVRFEKIEERVNRILNPLAHIADADAKSYPGIARIRNRAEELSAKYSSDVFQHVGYANACRLVASRFSKKLSGEARYILRKHILRFAAYGVDLDEASRIELRKLRTRLVKLQNAFQRNVTRASQKAFVFVEDERRVRGVSEEILRSARVRARKMHRKGYAFVMRQEAVDDVLSVAEHRGFRKSVWLAFNTRASSKSSARHKYDNTDLMLLILKTRHEIASILGYANYAERAVLTKSSTLRSAEGVDRFLEELAGETCTASYAELRLLERFAKKKHGIKKILPWDLSYVWSSKLGMQCTVDEDEARAFFPLQSVLRGMLRLSVDVFGCSLSERKVKGWHPCVRFFEVKDLRGKLVGGLYFDLIERDGKIGEACAVELVSRYERGKKIQLPVACLVTNLRQPKEGQDTTLCHTDIQTLFHEFGHIMHLLLSKNRYLKSSAFEIEPDAVELPSQLFEQWAWKKDALLLLADDAADKEKASEAIDSMLSMRTVYKGFEYGEHVAWSLLDWWLHKTPPEDESELLQVYFDAFALSDAKPIPPIARGAHTFTHAFSLGYGANYYSYLWSECLVEDIHAAFMAGKREGCLEAVVQRYVKEVLAPGSSRPFMDSFLAFRGREPKTSFFFKSLGFRENSSK